MAYTQSAVAPQNFAAAPPAPKRNIFLRFLDALEESNMRRAEEEIARYLRRNAGKLTDDVERQIGFRLNSTR